MPDITGILATFKKELFSGRYMIVILIWLSSLLFMPDNIKDFVSHKTGVPYSFQLLMFSISVLIYSSFNLVIKKIKAHFKLKKIKHAKEQAKREKSDKDIELIKAINALTKKERDIISYLLHSGFYYIEFDTGNIPKHLITLINKGFIVQITFPSSFSGECRFALEPSLKIFLREQIKLESLGQSNN